MIYRLLFLFISLGINGSICFGQFEAKVDSLNRLAYDLLPSNPDSAKTMLDQALMLSQRSKYSTGRKTSKAIQILLHSRLNEDTTAIRKFQDLEFDEPVDASNDIYGNLLQAVGNSYFNIGLDNYAKDYYKKSLEYFEKKDDADRLIGVYIDLATHLSKRGVYVESLAQYEKAYEIALAEERQDVVTGINRHLAIVYNRMGDYNQAKMFAQKSINDYLKKGDNEKIGDSYMTMANIYYMEALADSIALDYYYKALHHFELDSNAGGMAFIHANLADFFLTLNNNDSALYHLTKAEALVPDSDDYRTVRNFINLGEASVLMKKGEFLQAEEIVRGSLEQSKKTNELEYIKEAYLRLSEIKESIHEYDSALTYYRLYKNYSDSVISKSTERKYAEARIEIETIEKQYEIKRLKTESKLRMIYIISISGASILLITILGVSIRLLKVSTKKKRLQVEMERNKLHEELQLNKRLLADHSLAMIRKNELLGTLLEKAKKFNEHNGNGWSEIVSTIERSKSNEKDWADFNKYFGIVHSGFFDKLKAKYPNLSKNELRISALFRMNMSLKESSEILGVSPNSVKVARFRLKKKMKLPKDANLVEHISHIVNE